MIAPSEDEALSAARTGDLEAWDWIVRRNQELVFRSAYLVTRDTALAEATTRVVAVRAFRSLGSLDEGAELRPWLMRLTDTIARTQLREATNGRDARAPEPEPCPRMPASHSLPLPGTPMLAPTERAILVEAFDRLSDDDRNTIAARYAFGLGREAAAVRLSVSPETVVERLSSALSRLRRHVNQLAATATMVDDPRAPAQAVASRLGALSDDQLGPASTAAVMAELPWTPDVARISCERLAREAIAYPTTSADVGAAASAGPRATEHRLGRSSRPPARRGPSTLRGVGLLAGATLVGVAFAFSIGTARDLGLDLPTDRPAADRVAGVSPETAPRVALEPSALEPSPPDVSVVGVRRLERGGLKAVVRIEATTAMQDSATRTRLERKAAGDAWVTEDWTDAGEPLFAVMRPDTAYRFRVRSVDASGDETVSETSRVQLSVRGPRSDRLVRSGGDWRLRASPAGGKRLVAVTPGAQLATTVKGSNVALVGRDVPAVDPFSVRVDGGPWDPDPAADAPLGRWVLFSEDLEGGTHRIDLMAPSDGLGIDALLILRSLQA